MLKSENNMFPMTLLTGFLGAGKTTLLNKYLKSPAGAGTAVLVNEFGDVDVDGAILGTMSGGTQMLSLPNGCVCCEVQDDLAAALVELITRRDTDSIERCIVETSGLADPGSILRTVARDLRLKSDIKVVQTICVAAAPAIRNQVVRFVEAAEQIALADRIVVSKSELETNEQVNEIYTTLATRNPLAEIVVMGAEAEIDTMFLPLDKTPSIPSSRDHEHLHTNNHDHNHDHDHDHTHGISSFSIEIDTPLNHDVFRDILSFWIMRHSEDLLRVKGILCFADEPLPQLINIVHDICSIEPLPGAPDKSFLVFIGINLPEDEIRRDLGRCGT
ncbi:MAG: GTP-binding protein [Gammaproteobacteria bacterium]|jgi:G3E family GTPase